MLKLHSQVVLDLGYISEPIYLQYIISPQLHPMPS